MTFLNCFPQHQAQAQGQDLGRGQEQEHASGLTLGARMNYSIAHDDVAKAHPVSSYSSLFFCHTQGPGNGMKFMLLKAFPRGVHQGMRSYIMYHKPSSLQPPQRGWPSALPESSLVSACSIAPTTIGCI